LNDTERISRARAGDQAAWEALVSEHQEAIFRLAYLLLGDAQEAEDVAQESFVRAFRALNRFDADRFNSMRPWLMSIATNLARNRRRSVGRYMAALRRMVQAVPKEEAVASLGERSAQQWEAQTLWQAIKRLRPAEQEIVYLRYFLEMSEADMASALGMPHGTVKSRLHRALSRLRLVVD